MHATSLPCNHIAEESSFTISVLAFPAVPGGLIVGLTVNAMEQYGTVVSVYAKRSKGIVTTKTCYR